MPLFVCSFVCAEVTSFGLIIDDFETGPLFSDNAINVIQAGLDPAHVVGGVRSVDYYTLRSGSSLTIGPDFEIVAGPFPRNYFTIGYGSTGSLNLDLSEYTAIQFEFTSSSGGSTVDWVDFLIRSDSAGESTFRITIEEGLSQVLLPLSQAAADGVDLEDVDFLQMDTIRFTPSFVLDRIVVVPEPSGLLALSWLLGFTRWRRVPRP